MIDDDIETDVYRMFDSNMSLLYVGKSVDWPRRFYGHADKKWISDVAFIEITRYRTGGDARVAETNAIRAENPLYNVMNKLKPQPHAMPIMPRPKLELPPVIPDGYWIRNLIIVAMTKMTDPAAPTRDWSDIDVTERVIREMSRQERQGRRRAEIVVELERLASDPESPVQSREGPVNSITRLPANRYWIEL